MILNLIKLGIKVLLKTFCQKIKIKRIKILPENKKFKGNIKNLIIEAEEIIYRGIYLNYAKIKGSNLNIEFNKNIMALKIKDFQAETIIHITNENLKNIINKNCSAVNNKVREFVSQNSKIKKVSFENHSILFSTSEHGKIYEFIYKMNFQKNNIVLNDIKSKKYLIIPFDSNIVFESLDFYQKYLKIKFKSKVKLEN